MEWHRPTRFLLMAPAMALWAYMNVPSLVPGPDWSWTVLVLTVLVATGWFWSLFE